MFFKGSRYLAVDEYKAKGAKGKEHTVKKIRIIPTTEGTFEHTVREGERLDLLAYKYYDDPLKWWMICDANNAMYPDDLLKPGTKVTVPPNKTV